MRLFLLAAAGAALLCAQAPLRAPLQPGDASLPADTVIAKSADGQTITAGEIRTLLGSGDPKAINMAQQNPDLFLGGVFLMRYLKAEGQKAHLADESPLKEQIQYLIDRVISQAMVNRLREEYVVPENDINEFYAHNKSRYEQAWIKVIAIGFCPSMTPEAGTSTEDVKRQAEKALAAAHCTSKRTEDQAHDEAMGIVGRIRGGADFVKLVKQYSEDPDSKATDGDFGLVTRENSFKPEIKEAVFALGNGEVSNPIRSGSYFYIIKIKEKTVQPITNVHEAIVQELKQRHFDTVMKELNVRMKPTIERPDFFSALAKP